MRKQLHELALKADKELVSAVNGGETEYDRAERALEIASKCADKNEILSPQDYCFLAEVMEQSEFCEHHDGSLIVQEIVDAMLGNSKIEAEELDTPDILFKKIQMRESNVKTQS